MRGLTCWSMCGGVEGGEELHRWACVGQGGLVWRELPGKELERLDDPLLCNMQEEIKGRLRKLYTFSVLSLGILF